MAQEKAGQPERLTFFLSPALAQRLKLAVERANRPGRGTGPGDPRRQLPRLDQPKKSIPYA